VGSFQAHGWTGVQLLWLIRPSTSSVSQEGGLTKGELVVEEGGLDRGPFQGRGASLSRFPGTGFVWGTWWCDRGGFLSRVGINHQRLLQSHLSILHHCLRSRINYLCQMHH
jgi:hypothetical protein